ncbi:MAG TPA: hypothetical protein DD364_01505 [Ruminococcaceae bacterium]|jgi:hypothetical protein|nr:hypothetical protein [Oscillospiraceae bacterium]
MDKILICLQVPAISRSFDVFVPLDMNINELIEVLVKGVIEMSDNSYISSNEENLNLKNNILLNPALTLQSYSIKDGEEIFLI